MQRHVDAVGHFGDDAGRGAGELERGARAVNLVGAVKCSGDTQAEDGREGDADVRAEAHLVRGVRAVRVHGGVEGQSGAGNGIVVRGNVAEVAADREDAERGVGLKVHGRGRRRGITGEGVLAVQVKEPKERAVDVRTVDIDQRDGGGKDVAALASVIHAADDAGDDAERALNAREVRLTVDSGDSRNDRRGVVGRQGDGSRRPNQGSRDRE